MVPKNPKKHKLETAMQLIPPLSAALDGVLCRGAFFSEAHSIKGLLALYIEAISKLVVHERDGSRVSNIYKSG
jgi:hypothetical protein